MVKLSWVDGLVGERAGRFRCVWEFMYIWFVNIQVYIWLIVWRINLIK